MRQRPGPACTRIVCPLDAEVRATILPVSPSASSPLRSRSRCRQVNEVVLRTMHLRHSPRGLPISLSPYRRHPPPSRIPGTSLLGVSRLRRPLALRGPSGLCRRVHCAGHTSSTPQARPIDLRTRTAMMAEGPDSQYLLRHLPRPGVPQILCMQRPVRWPHPGQWAKHSARPSSARLAAGEDRACAPTRLTPRIDYTRGLVPRVQEITKSRVATSSTTACKGFPGLARLPATFGLFVSFGRLGTDRPIRHHAPAEKNSLFAHGGAAYALGEARGCPSHRTRTFSRRCDGAVKIQIHARMPLAEAAEPS